MPLKYLTAEEAAHREATAPLQHTAHAETQPGLAYACKIVCKLKVGECLKLSRDEVNSMDIRANPHIGGSPHDRIMGNIIGSGYAITLHVDHHGGGTFCRVRNEHRTRTYLDPDYRDGGPEDLRVVAKKS